MRHEPLQPVRLIDTFGHELSRLHDMRLNDAMARLPDSWSDAERREYAVARMDKDFSA